MAKFEHKNFLKKALSLRCRDDFCSKTIQIAVRVLQSCPTKLNLIVRASKHLVMFHSDRDFNTLFKYSQVVPDKKEDKFDLLGLANQLSPFTRPLLKNPLDPGQLTPEMMTLATNNVDPVYAQQYTPILEQTSNVSFQDQLNEIQAEANAARRLAGNNPAAQSAIAAQAANAKNKVLGEAMRTNQMLAYRIS